MGNSDDPLAHLTQSLTDDYNQHTGEQLRDAVGERERRLESVPAVTELAMSHTLRRTLIWYMLMMLGVAAFALAEPKGRFGGVLFLLMGLIFAVCIHVHRRVGKDPMIRLTRTHLWVPCVEGEIALRDVAEMHIRGGRMTQITLTLREGAPWPVIRNSRVLLMPSARFKRSRTPKLQLTVVRLELNGQVVLAHELLELLDTYWQAARLHAELQELKAYQPGWE